jgi:beta-glucosidase
MNALRLLGISSIFGIAAMAAIYIQGAQAQPAPAAAPAAAAPAAGPAPDVGGPDAIWRDASKSPDERARDLLPRLTLAEKIALLHGDGTFTSPGLPRFKIGKLWMDDGPQGVREENLPDRFGSANHTDDFTTALPADIGLAATFDTDMALAYGNVIGEEARTRGKNIMLSPGLNIMRTPLNGRNSEFLGEDPFLASRMAVGFITAMQSHGVSATPKHYAMNNQETQRGSVNVHADERTIREIYLPAFKASITEAHAWSIMAAYNRVNGQYCSENEFLLTQVLKKDWNFQGLVMTDWGGCHSTVPAANNGLDLEMGSNLGAAGGNHDNDHFGSALMAAVTANPPTVPMSRIDDMALRNLRVMAFTGLLDPQDKVQPKVPLMSPEHIEAARKIEEAGMVLLKNDRQVLPLDTSRIKTIAVIGQNANTKFAHDGNSAQIKTTYEITPLEGITTRAGSNIKVNFVPGYTGIVRGRGRGAAGGRQGLGGAVTPTPASAPAAGNPDLIAAAVEAAKNADVAIVVAGLYRSQDQEGADRRDMNLPAGQAELIAAVVKANPHTVVILNGGSPSVIEPWISDAAGLIMYWYGGTEGGNALARVLFGDVNPSGHLPCTYPKQLADSPAHFGGDINHYPGTGGAARGAGGGGRGSLTPETGPQEDYAEGILVGYRWFDAKNIEPEYPFGFGLSYTQFTVSDLKLQPTGTDGHLTVQATVNNIGKRDGAEVVQVYVHQNNPNPAFPRPPKELKAFQKITVAAGGTGTVSMKLDASSLAYYDPAKHAWVAEAGDYTIYAGDSSRNLPVKATFTLPQTITIKEGM